MSKNGIPYQVFGGLKFYETAHIKDILSHLKIVMNLKDEISWHRVLTMIDGVGPKTADKLIEGILARTSLEDVLGKAFSDKYVPKKSMTGHREIEEIPASGQFARRDRARRYLRSRLRLLLAVI